MPNKKDKIKKRIKLISEDQTVPETETATSELFASDDEETPETEVNELEEIQNLSPVVSTQKSMVASENALLSIFNTQKNGKKILIATEVIEKYGSTNSVEVCINDRGVAFEIDPSESSTLFRMKVSGKKMVIYSSCLVDAITEKFNLNFDHQTTISFSDVCYKNHHGRIAAFFNLKH